MNRTAVFSIVGVIALGIAAYLLFGIQAPSQNDEAGTDTSTHTTSSVSTTTEAYDLKAQWPTGDSQAEQQVAAFIKSEEGTLTLQAQNDYDEYHDATDTPPYPWRPYSFVIGYDEYNHSGYKSYVVNEYMYTGGANGMETVRSFNYSPEGNSITLANIIAPQKQAAFLTALKAKLYEVNGVPYGANDTFGDAISSLMFADLKTFWVNDAVVAVQFNKYDVAPGAAGPVKVELSRADYASI